MTSVFYVVRLRSSLPREFLAIKLFGAVRLSDCFNWSLSWCSSRLYQHVSWVLPEYQLLIKLLCYLRSCLWFHKNKSNKLFFQKNYLGQVTSHLLRKIKEGNKRFLQKVPFSPEETPALLYSWLDLPGLLWPVAAVVNPWFLCPSLGDWLLLLLLYFLTPEFLPLPLSEEKSIKTAKSCGNLGGSWMCGVNKAD